MDAADINLKGFAEDFYYTVTGAQLKPIMDTIRYAVHETECRVA